MKFLVMFQDHTKEVFEAVNINLAAVKASRSRKKLNVVLTIEQVKNDSK